MDKADMTIPSWSASNVEILELLSLVGTAVCQDFGAAAASHGLTHMQVRVLTLAADAPLPMRDIARSLGCDASNITGLVDRLEGGGFVKRESGTTDRRIKHIVVTDTGRTALARIRGHMHGHAALGDLADHERDCLRTLLAKLGDKLAPTPGTAEES